jgi:RNA polymerase sigma-70 factor (ECF subfamily)
MPSASTSMPVAEIPSEDDLVRRVLGGDRAAFGPIYNRYVRPVFNLASRMVPQQEAEDVTQEVFLQVYRNLDSFQYRSSLYTWIYKVASNTCLQHRKKLHRRREDAMLARVSETDVVGHALVIPTEPGRVVERRQTLARVVDAIASLPAQQRIVIVLGPIQGHCYAHMARILGVSSDMIKGRLHRARLAIQRALEGKPGANVLPTDRKRVRTAATAGH